MEKRVVFLFFVLSIIFIFLGFYYWAYWEGEDEDEQSLVEIKKDTSLKGINNSFSIEASEKRIPCHDGNYKMAFILLEDADNPVLSIMEIKIEVYKKEFSKRFKWATMGKGNMDATYPLVIQKIDIEKFYEKNQKYPSLEIVTNKFYETHPDDFDFITVYGAFQDENYGPMFHHVVSNNVQGLGSLSVFNQSKKYGSEGKLLGVNWMREIGWDYDKGHDEIYGVNGILHETSHQWGIYLSFPNQEGTKIGKMASGAHWSSQLDTGDYDTLRGRRWTDNGDGTFTSIPNEDGRTTYSDFMLYLIGFLPKGDVKPAKLIISNDEIENPRETIKGYIEEITIDEIIELAGERYCVEVLG